MTIEAARDQITAAYVSGEAALQSLTAARAQVDQAAQFLLRTNYSAGGARAKLDLADTVKVARFDDMILRRAATLGLGVIFGRQVSGALGYSEQEFQRVISDISSIEAVDVEEES